ncbi:hypothetical protein [Melissospora conviva]|uniref:hypothetical protein n=1 Tax=Melissospora conviva TaxID=3388432 RepID=UPI003C1D3793
MYKVMGIVNDITTCDCCNRRGLRRTVALMPLDIDGTPDGEVTYFGTGCAATALGTTNSAVIKRAMVADARRAEIRRAARRDLPELRAMLALPIKERSQAYLARFRNYALGNGVTIPIDLAARIARAEADLAA